MKKQSVVYLSMISFILGMCSHIVLSPVPEKNEASLTDIFESVQKIEQSVALPELEQGVVIEYEDLPDGFQFRQGGLICRIRRPIPVAIKE